MKGKKVIVGVSGGIAAYKAAELVRLLAKADTHTSVAMSPRLLLPRHFRADEDGGGPDFDRLRLRLLGCQIGQSYAFAEEHHLGLGHCAVGDDEQPSDFAGLRHP